MKAEPAGPASVEEYLSACEPGARQALEQIRGVIREAAPGAEERISYRIPAFFVDGRVVVYVAAHARHIGLYPAPVGNPELAGDLAPYASGKGTAKFPLGKPIPFDLVRRIVQFRMRENEALSAARRRKK
ncbi:MAG TPA: DUF1801 domain-containing protein [Longimicrobium sp.]|nr:DUF1801 domain-containing protein [Longimicrobium sp.]